jgi:hypothetical protein
MARRTSRRRKTRRNPKYVVANKRRRRRSSRRKKGLMANMMKKNGLVQSVLVPVLGGTAGFVAARAIGNFWAQKDILTSDPRLAKTLAAAVGIPATGALAMRMAPSSVLRRNQGAIMLGMGLAASEAWLRDTPLLGGSPVAAAVLEEEVVSENGANAAGAYYDYPTNRQGQALSAYYDYPTNRQGQALSGDYYTAGMLGADDPADQGQVDSAMDTMETGVSAMSTVVPTDLAMKAPVMPQVRPVSESFAKGAGDRGYAGGMFARHLFSGMMGS